MSTSLSLSRIKLFFIFTAFLAITSAYSQTLDWVRVGGERFYDEAGDIVRKSSKGSIYTAGHFKGSVTFESSTISSTGEQDIFLAKYDSNGNLLWLKSIGTRFNDGASKMLIDNDENIFLYQTIDSNTMSKVRYPGYINKYNSSGNLIWSKEIITISADWRSEENNIENFAIDNFGNLYISGEWSYKFVLGDFTLVDNNYQMPTGIASIRGFLIKINPNGNIDWSKSITAYNKGTPYGSQSLIGSTKLQCTNDGNIYFKGTTLFDSIDVDNGNYLKNNTLNSFKDFYIKYNQKGTAVSFFSQPQNINNFLVTSQNEIHTLIGESYETIFIRLDSLGNITLNKRLEPDSTFLFSGEMKTDGNNNVYFGGRGGVSKYDKDGNLLWVHKGSTLGNNIDWEINGSAVFTGGYFNNAVIGDTLKSKGFMDAFTAKVDCKPVVAGITGETTLCAGSFDYSLPFIKGLNYHWSIDEGGIVTSNGNTSSIYWTQEGIHTITVTPENQCGLGKPTTLKVRVKVKPSIPILTGDTITCLGSTAYSVKSIPEVSYVWGISNGGAIAPINNTAVVNWTSTGNYSLFVTPSNSCGIGPQLKSNIIIDKIPSQPSLISGNKDVCLGNQLYSIISESRTIYNWSISSGGTMNAINNQNSINWTTPGSHSITVSPYNHCGIGQAQILTVNAKDVPAQPNAITGSSPICKGNQTYSIVELPDVTYTWNLSGGGALTSLKGIANVNFVQAGTYTIGVIPHNTCGAGTARTKSVQVIDIPSQPDSIIGLKNVCLGNQTYLIPPVKDVNYNWSLSGGGTLIPNGNLSQVNWTTPGTYVITVTPFNNCGYGTSTSIIVVVKNISSQISKITGKDKTCLVSEVYNVPFISGFTYAWSLSNGGTLTTANNSANVTWSSPGLYTLSVTTSDGCTNALPVIINDIPQKPAPIVGDSSVCPGNTSYYVDAVSEVNYGWNISGGGSIASLASTSSTDWVTPGNYTLSVTPSNYCGVGPSRTLNISVNSKPTQAPIITGPVTVCLDSSVYKALHVNGITYTWSLNDGGLLIPKSDSSSVQWTKTGDYTLGLIATNQCGSSPTAVKNIKVIDKPVKPIITGDTTSCILLKGYKATNIESGLSYHWNLDNGGILTTNNDSSTVNWNTIGKHLLSVTPTNMCGAGESASKSVKVLDIPPTVSSIVGDTSTCKVLKTYVVPPTTGVNYSWNLSGGGYITSSGNSTNINWINSGLYTLSVYPMNQCGSGATTSKNIHVLNPPSQPNIIQGPDSSCIGSTSYIVDSLSGTTYNWTLTGSGAIQQSIHTNKVNIEWSIKGLYGINVIPSNICGTGPSRTKNVWVDRIPTVASIEGPEKICKGTLTQYSILPEKGNQYSWQYSGSGFFMFKKDSAFINPLDHGTYELKVTPSNYCGIGDTKSLNIQVNNKPVLLNSINGDNTTCTNNNSIYSIPSQSQSSYQWSVYPNGGTVNNLNEKLNIQWAIPGNYKISLFLNNECGNSDTTEKEVQIMETPIKPSIKQSRDTLISSILGKNKWYFNGALLPNDSTEKILLKNEGEYYVQGINQCGGGPLSDVYYFIEHSDYYGFPVIPNPASSTVTIKIPKYLKWKQIDLMDELGQKIMHLDNNNNNEAIFIIEDLNPGLYIFRIETELGIYNEKLIKL